MFFMLYHKKKTSKIFRTDCRDCKLTIAWKHAHFVRLVSTQFLDLAISTRVNINACTVYQYRKCFTFLKVLMT